MNRIYSRLVWIALLAAGSAGAQSLEKTTTDTAVERRASGPDSTLARMNDTASGDGSATVSLRRDSAGNTVISRSGGGCDTTVRSSDCRARSGFLVRLGDWRARGWGGSGAVMPGLYAIGTRPIKELINRVRPLRGKNFNLHEYNYEPFYLHGGAGYAGLGNGMRLGGAGMSGERHFVSAPYGGDSAVALDVAVQFGGLLLEKAVVKGPWNGVFGGVVGSGSISAGAHLVDRDVSSVFDPDSIRQPAGGGVKARFIYLQAHGGATYTVCPWFHLGAALSVPVFVSPGGFDSRTPDFITVNPGMQVRCVFGNLG